MRKFAPTKISCYTVTPLTCLWFRKFTIRMTHEYSIYSIKRCTVLPGLAVELLSGPNVKICHVFMNPPNNIAMLIILKVTKGTHLPEDVSSIARGADTRAILQMLWDPILFLPILQHRAYHGLHMLVLLCLLIVNCQIYSIVRNVCSWCLTITTVKNNQTQTAWWVKCVTHVPVFPPFTLGDSQRKITSRKKSAGFSCSSHGKPVYVSMHICAVKTLQTILQ